MRNPHPARHPYCNVIYNHPTINNMMSPNHIAQPRAVLCNCDTSPQVCDTSPVCLILAHIGGILIYPLLTTTTTTSLCCYRINYSLSFQFPSVYIFGQKIINSIHLKEKKTFFAFVTLHLPHHPFSPFLLHLGCFRHQPPNHRDANVSNHPDYFNRGWRWVDLFPIVRIRHCLLNEFTLAPTVPFQIPFRPGGRSPTHGKTIAFMYTRCG